MDGDTPICLCGNASQMLLVTKEGSNKGREFYSCANRVCKFFKWVDSPSSSAPSAPSVPTPTFFSARGPKAPVNPPFKAPAPQSTAPSPATPMAPMETVMVKATAALMSAVETMNALIRKLEEGQFPRLDTPQPPRKKARHGDDIVVASDEEEAQRP